MGRVVLVTGVSGDLGGRFARMVAADPGVDRVIGVDVAPPRADLGEVRFIRADIRNPVITKVIAGESVDTVVHMSLVATPGYVGGRTSMKELNVIGTMQLLAACQRAPSLQRLVVKSSTAVYGCSSRDPAMFTEDMSPQRMPRSGYGKDMVEVESYVRGFARRRPEVSVTTLRVANSLGATIASPMAQYFRLPVIPTVLGYDARMQFLHETDLLEVLRHATTSDVEGTFNVAGSGIMMLSQMIRRLGKATVPLPSVAAGPLGSLVRQARLADFSPDQMAFLTYGRGVDTARMRDLLGFEPDYTTEQTFEDFRRAQRPGPLSAERVTAVEDRVVEVLAGGGHERIGGGRG